jgi:hypothetical protein
MSSRKEVGQHKLDANKILLELLRAGPEPNDLVLDSFLEEVRGIGNKNFTADNALHFFVTVKTKAPALSSVQVTNLFFACMNAPSPMTVETINHLIKHGKGFSAVISPGTAKAKSSSDTRPVPGSDRHSLLPGLHYTYRDARAAAERRGTGGGVGGAGRGAGAGGGAGAGAGRTGAGGGAGGGAGAGAGAGGMLVVAGGGMEDAGDEVFIVDDSPITVPLPHSVSERERAIITERQAEQQRQVVRILEGVEEHSSEFDSLISQQSILYVDSGRPESRLYHHSKECAGGSAAEEISYSDIGPKCLDLAQCDKCVKKTPASLDGKRTLDSLPTLDRLLTKGSFIRHRQSKTFLSGVKADAGAGELFSAIAAQLDVLTTEAVSGLPEERFHASAFEVMSFAAKTLHEHPTASSTQVMRSFEEQNAETVLVERVSGWVKCPGSSQRYVRGLLQYLDNHDSLTKASIVQAYIDAKKRFPLFTTFDIAPHLLPQAVTQAVTQAGFLEHEVEKAKNRMVQLVLAEVRLQEPLSDVTLANLPGIIRALINEAHAHTTQAELVRAAYVKARFDEADKLLKEALVEGFCAWGVQAGLTLTEQANRLILALVADFHVTILEIVNCVRTFTQLKFDEFNRNVISKMSHTQQMQLSGADTLTRERFRVYLQGSFLVNQTLEDTVAQIK